MTASSSDARSVDEYLSKNIAERLVHELRPVLEMKELTRNTDLLGAYAEAAVRRLARRVVYPLHVSTGAVVDHPMPEKLRQVDLIAWAPCPAPSLFEVEEFCVVPRGSSFGVLEVKRSNYSGVEDLLEKFNEESASLTVAPWGQANDATRSGAMGVVCVIEGTPSARLTNLFDSGAAVGIFQKTSETVVRSKDVLKLVNFLYYVGWRYRRHASQSLYQQLKT